VVLIACTSFLDPVIIAKSEGEKLKV